MTRQTSRGKKEAGVAEVKLIFADPGDSSEDRTRKEQGSPLQ